jgi:hypothetical protein
VHISILCSSLVLSLLLASAPVVASAGVEVGTPAPPFTVADSSGRPVSLADYKGKFVVLEWTNDGCPFVQHYYTHGNMQALQSEYTGKGVVWLSIVSSAPGRQGYVTGSEADRLTQTRKAHPTAVLLDPSGTVGHLYKAKTTPDMYVIDPAGTLVYEGAIDSRPSTDPDDITGATAYVKLALDAAMSGKPVATAVTSPYGCSIKYQ